MSGGRVQFGKTMLFLSQDEVKQSITMDEAIASAEVAYACSSAGKSVTPIRTPVPVAGQDGVTLFMPGYVPDVESVGVKIVSVFPGNPALGFPTIMALIVLVDARTGAPVAAMEGSFVTALRTGAAAAAAAKYLARSDASVVAIFGAGVQARTQLEALSRVRALREARVFDVLPEMAGKYAAEMEARLGFPVRAAASREGAVRGADVIMTATTSKTPVFDGAWLEPGVHVSGIGSFTPEMQEIDETAVRRADRIVVDSREAVLAEAGDIIIPLRKGIISEGDLYAEVGEIVLGRKKGRERSEEITYYKGVGLSVLDVTVAAKIFANADARGLGTVVKL